MREIKNKKWEEMNKLFDNIESKYDMLNDCYWGVKELFEMGNIVDLDDVEWYLENYIDEYEEMVLGPINICKKMEDRDFVRSLFNV